MDLWKRITRFFRRRRKEALPKDVLQVWKPSVHTVRFACGHDGPRWYSILAWGEVIVLTKYFFKDRPACPPCLMLMFLRCCLCGGVIRAGDPVAFYAGIHRRFKGAWVAEYEGQSVGCLRQDCCPSGAFFGGHWTGEGVSPAFPGGMTAAAAAFTTGGAVMVGNTSDPASIRMLPNLGTKDGIH